MEYELFPDYPLAGRLIKMRLTGTVPLSRVMWFLFSLLRQTPHSEADVEGKIFLGGLTWQTTEDMLKTHFGKWGALNDVILMRNKITGEPRGFGFVQFQQSSCGSCVFKFFVSYEVFRMPVP